MESKKVSVIVPAYNVESYIEKCVRSICRQTYTNLEILVVDDGSQDHTYSKLQSLAKEDERIIVLHHENRGVSATRNMALERANGDYCCFVDGDDWIEPAMIAVLVRALEDTGSDWVNCQYVRNSEDGNELERYNFVHGLRSMEHINDKINFLFNELLVYQVGFEVWNKIYKLSMIRENKLRFCEDCKMGEDLGFNLCYAAKAKKINCISERLYHYRIRSNSAMSEADNKKYNFEQYVIFMKHVQETWERMKAQKELQELYVVCFSRTMDNAVRGLCDVEIAELVENLSLRSFYLEQNNRVIHNKKILCKWYGKQSGGLVWKHSLAVKRLVVQLSIAELFYLYLLDVYRKLRGRSRIENIPHA